MLPDYFRHDAERHLVGVGCLLCAFLCHAAFMVWTEYDYKSGQAFNQFNTLDRPIMSTDEVASVDNGKRRSLDLFIIGVILLLIDRVLFDSLTGGLVTLAIWGTIVGLPFALAYTSRRYGWAKIIAAVFIIAAIWDLAFHTYLKSTHS